VEKKPDLVDINPLVWTTRSSSDLPMAPQSTDHRQICTGRSDHRCR